MKILFINNAGAGFASHIDVPEGTTAQQLFAQKLPDCSAEDYLIRVNRLPVTAEQVLQEGDRVSMTANKITGATRPAYHPR